MKEEWDRSSFTSASGSTGFVRQESKTPGTSRVLSLEYPVTAGVAVNQFGQREPKALTAIKVRIARALVERRIPFEFVDLPVK